MRIYRYRVRITLGGKGWSGVFTHPDPTLHLNRRRLDLLKLCGLKDQTGVEVCCRKYSEVL